MSAESRRRVTSRSRHIALTALALAVGGCVATDEPAATLARGEATAPSPSADSVELPVGGHVATGGAATGGAGTGGLDTAGKPGLGGAAGSSGNRSGAGGEAAGAPGGSAGTNAAGTSATDPGTEGDGDFTIGPNYTAAPESRTSSGTPKGTIHKFTMPSSSSAIYPVDVQSDQPFTRSVQVYIPNGYVDNTEVPFMVAQDGARHQGQIIPVVDNLIASKKLPKLVVILIEPGPGDGTGSERSNEYDKVSDKYVTFMETEVLPKVQADYHVKLTTNPEGRAAFGGSSGGPAAFGMAWFRPDLYRRIVTFSGSFVNLARDATYPNGAWDYHQTLIPGADPKPIRVAISCGEKDNNSTSSESSHRNWVIANQNLAKALRAKGYHYRFTYGKGSGHDGDELIKQTLPEIMLWLWRGYIPPT